MRQLSITSLGIAALLLSGAPAYTSADSVTETPGATEKAEPKTDGLGGKVKTTAKAAKSDATDSWLTAKVKIALYGDDRMRVDSDDKAIASMVEQRLKKDPQLKSAKINARVDSGIVTITGEVKSLMLSSRASEVLSDVPGVRAVRNDLTYVPRTSMGQAPAADRK